MSFQLMTRLQAYKDAEATQKERELRAAAQEARALKIRKGTESEILEFQTEITKLKTENAQVYSSDDKFSFPSFDVT